MNLTKQILSLIILLVTFKVSAFTIAVNQRATSNYDTDSLVRDKDSLVALVPDLIPQKKNGKFGYIDKEGNVIIPHTYSNVSFFSQDCHLLNSTSETVQKFGSDQYASVRLNGIDYRIDKKGKRVYRFKESDLGTCPIEYKAQRYFSYVRQGYYGIIEKDKFINEMDYRQFLIYPQFQYLHVMEGDDINNPMIVAAYDNRFGVIDIKGNIIIPFEYADIKRNFSWKLAHLFEVTRDGQSYYFVDVANNAY